MNTQADYISRINKTLDYIEAKSDQSITLEELADIANFSRFHFNRIFHSIVNETPFQFIIRRRIEKAASMIITNKHESITDIAYKCGFSDISVFSRNFKNYFSISASQFRINRNQNSKTSQLNSNPPQVSDKPAIYFCPEKQTIKWRTKMEINKSMEVMELPKMTLAYIRNIGPYNGDQKMFGELRNKLFTWAAARGLMNGTNFKFLVMYHDDPNVALSNNLIMSLCLTVPEGTKTGGEIGLMELEPARYAVAKFELTGSDFQKAWDWVYSHWLPQSGYQPDDKPCFESYLREPVDGNYLIEICVPVKPA